MNIGEKIKRLRIQNDLTQEELGNRAELSKGFISQLERDLTSPSIASLTDILQCLGTDLKHFFNEKEDSQLVFKKSDYFENYNSDLKHIIKWIVPNAQKNIMEPILIGIEPHGTTLLDQPHDGEEFGYVLKGSILVHHGNVQHKVKTGESFYFESNKEHFLSNPSTKSAQILWVSSPPTF